MRYVVIYNVTGLRHFLVVENYKDHNTFARQYYKIFARTATDHIFAFRTYEKAINFIAERKRNQWQ